MLVLRLAIIAMICLAQRAAAGQHGIVKRSTSIARCRLRWLPLLSTFNEDRRNDAKRKITYTTGVVKKTQAENGTRDGSSNELSLTAEAESGIYSISATYTDSSTQERTTTELTGSDLAQTRQLELEVIVPPRTRVTVWQLLGRYGEYDARFNSFELRHDSNRPQAGGENCEVGMKAPIGRRSIGRRSIGSSTLVRLKHWREGKYMVTYVWHNWERATLGPSRDVHYRLERDGAYVRISISHPIYETYEHAYSSVSGRIFFKKFDRWDDTQLWSMSISDPKDGDSVTFRNKYWPNCGLVYDGGVFCYTGRFHQWIIEVI